MRRAAKIDQNQAAIVAALEREGCSVRSLAALGGGFPDLLVGWGLRVGSGGAIIHQSGRNVLLEIKSPPGPDGGKSKSGQKLNRAQQLFHENWRGPIYVVTTPQEALQKVFG